MFLLKILILIILCSSISLSSSNTFLEKELESKEDPNKSIHDICNENGWDYEQYTLVTKDGYILQLMRIPGALNEEKPYKRKPAILLQHALECDASEWVINSPEKAPAFNLATAGYDVWMGNNRGNKYSLNHRTLDPNNSKDAPLYWDFSYEEMGIYDLPAEIDFILNLTNHKQLSYIGHSQGTTQFLIGLSMNYQYFKEKVNVFIALAPVARLDNTKALFLKLMAPEKDLIKDVMINVFHYYNLFPPNWPQSALASVMCFLIKGVCEAFVSLFIDLDPSVDNFDRMTIYLYNIPSGAGYKSFLHYAQFITSKKFQRFDYGSLMNMKIYNQPQPPEYNLANILDFPIALFSGSFDLLADTTDVKWLSDNLGKNVVFNKTYKLGHMSFAIAKDMSFFQVDVMSVLCKYSTN